MRPMLATSGEARSGPPPGPDWVHEIKWDGIRLLADVHEGKLRLHTRGERDIAVAFPELTALAAVADDLLLDGEAVAMVGGKPSFSHVVERVHTASPSAAARLAARWPATYLAFDLLRLDGLDLTPLPWSVRRQALERVLDQVPGTQLSPVFEDGAQLLALTREQGLEGVLSKRRDGAYHPGSRTLGWLKFPHRRRYSVVIGGWRPQAGRTTTLGAVHVGLPLVGPDGMPRRSPDGAAELSYLGRVGSGLAGRAGAQLYGLLAQLGQAACPFATPLASVDAKGSTWVQPRVVVDVEALGLSPEAQRLRQPSYVGLRPDLVPEDLIPAAGS